MTCLNIENIHTTQKSKLYIIKNAYSEKSSFFLLSHTVSILKVIIIFFNLWFISPHFFFVKIYDFREILSFFFLMATWYCCVTVPQHSQPVSLRSYFIIGIVPSTYIILYFWRCFLRVNF